MELPANNETMPSDRCCMRIKRSDYDASDAINREDVKQAVIVHLEGGDEPYKLRARKYNIQ